VLVPSWSINLPTERVQPMNLHNAFMLAADQLAEASLAIAVGRVRGATQHAIDAFENVLGALVDLRGPQREELRGHEMHDIRFALARQLLGLSHGRGKQLKELRHIDRYGNRRVGGKPETIGETKATATVHEVRGYLSTLASRFLPPPSLSEFRRRMARADRLGPEEELVCLLAARVVRGECGHALEAQLRSLEQLYAERSRDHSSLVAQLRAAEILSYRAHIAMSHGRPEDLRRGLNLTEAALSVWRPGNKEPARIAYALRLQSTMYRMLGEPKRAVPVMDEARQWAVASTGQLDATETESGALIMTLGEPGAAARLLVPIRWRARAAGNHALEGLVLQLIGRAKIKTGQRQEGEAMLLRAEGLVPTELAITHVIIANALTELYAAQGCKQEAHKFAARVRRLGAEHRHQLERLEKTVAQYPKIWRPFDRMKTL
jgi:hypothetical protein